MSLKPPVGLLNLNKPAGVTSHDVVQRVRRIIGQRKVGHTGTLDPLATGVLLVCVGQATRLIEYLMGGQKLYQATVRLGQSTTTYDAEGDLTQQTPVNHLTQANVEAVLPQFIGQISQKPPVFSALKKDGVPLYKLARQGQAPEPPARPVTIYQLTLNNFQLPEFQLTVRCGAGTYIRSLAHDVGQALGVGAHLTALQRLENSGWSINQALSLNQLAEAVSAGRLADVLHPPEAMLKHLPRLNLSTEQAQHLGMGQQIAWPAEALPATPQGILAGFNPADELVAVLTQPQPGHLKPHKVFKPYRPAS